MPRRLPARSRLHFALTPVLAALACAALPAVAQTTSATEPAATATTTLEAVKVTARKREESLQDVPVAVTALTAEQLDKLAIKDLGDLQGQVPNLTIYAARGSNTTLTTFIRGVGQADPLWGVDPGVGIYFDDVYIARPQGALLDVFDVGRIEVLRGPQGTLYGKNTTAGAINITTNQPTFDFEGAAELTAGNLNYKQAKGAVSGPLSDTVAARIAVATTTRRGTIYNVTTKRWINEQDNLGLRGTLLFKPSEDLSVTLSGDYSKQDPEGFGTSFVRVGRTQRALSRQYDALVAAYNAANPTRPYAVPSRNIYDRLTDIDANLNAGNKIGGASLKVKWD
ncbi:MAG: TonB-dependent receptor, partial [Rubrivivax sp.]